MAEYIKREDAMSHPFANGKYDKRNAKLDFILGHESYKEWLENTPAADVRENVKGHLIKKIRHRHCLSGKAFIDDAGRPVCETISYEDVCFYCSVCGKVQNGEWMNYCDNCGADMRGDKNG